MLESRACAKRSEGSPRQGRLILAMAVLRPRPVGSVESLEIRTAVFSAPPSSDPDVVNVVAGDNIL